MAVLLNVSIDQGADFDFQVVVVNDVANTVIDLSSYTANAAMKLTPTSTTSYPLDVLLSPSGVITMSMNSASTALVPAGRYRYDLRVTSNTAVVSRLIEGVATVDPGIF